MALHVDALTVFLEVVNQIGLWYFFDLRIQLFQVLYPLEGLLFKYFGYFEHVCADTLKIVECNLSLCFKDFLNSQLPCLLVFLANWLAARKIEL